MVETIVVKAFAALDGSERSRLLQLTKEGPSGFRNWLTDVDQSGKFAAMVYLGNEIVGWAGACQGFGAMQIGAYVDVRYRKRNLGTKALTGLMDHLTSFGRGRYVQYETECRGFFQPTLDKYGYEFHSQQDEVMFAEHIQSSRTS